MEKELESGTHTGYAIRQLNERQVKTVSLSILGIVSCLSLGGVELGFGAVTPHGIRDVLGHNHITPLFLIHDQEIIEGLTKFRLYISVVGLAVSQGLMFRILMRKSCVLYF